MDTGAIVSVSTALAGLAGGFWGGRQTVGMQSQAISALQARVDDQQKTIDTIPNLQMEIRVLQELVTQRANVDKVIEIVTRTEDKVDGLVSGSRHHSDE